MSPYCKTYDNADGHCLSCYQGYGLSNGDCVVSTTNCKTHTDEGKCATCYNGYALYQGDCVPVNSLADIVLYYAECCPEKLEQLRAEGRLPQ